jgi:hypothetical protein
MARKNPGRGGKLMNPQKKKHLIRLLIEALILAIVG